MVLLVAGITSALESISVMNALSISIERKDSLLHIMSAYLMCVRSKEGYLVYQQWCDLWSREANTPPNLKMFFVDQFMSYWVRNCVCGGGGVVTCSCYRYNVCYLNVANGDGYPGTWSFTLLTCPPSLALTVMLLKIL